MRIVLATAAGFVLGGAAGVAYSAASAHREAPAGSRPSPEAESAARSATLVAAPARSAPSAAATTVTLDLAECAAWRVIPGEAGQPWTGALWATLSIAYAGADRLDDAARVIESAFAAGVSPDDASQVLAPLDEGRRLALVKLLRPKHPAAAWDPLLVAAIRADAGDGAGAFDDVLALLRDGKVPIQAGAARLAAIDARRADAALRALATEQRWFSNQVEEAWNGFAGHDDVRAAWGPLLEARRAAEAAAKLDDARARVHRQPSDLEAWKALAGMEQDAGDRAAVASWRRVLELDPYDVDALDALARADPAAALEIAERIGERSSDPEVLGALARARLAVGRAADAMTLLLRLPPDSVAEWWRSGAAALDPVRALASIDEHLRSPRYRDSDAWLRARGDALAALGRFADAFEAYRDAWNAEWRDDDALHALARSDPERAKDLFEEALRTGPDPFVERGLALALVAGGRPAEGRAILVRLATADDAAYADLAGAGDPAALAHLEEQAPRSDRADEWVALAGVHRSLGRLADARAALDRALALDERLPWRIARLTWR